MSKELEALNKIQHDFGQLKGQELVNCYETIFNGLKRLESIDNSSPSKALEDLEKMVNLAIQVDDEFELLDDEFGLYHNKVKKYILKTQENEKVLSIIKEKEVDIHLLKACITCYIDGLNAYNSEIKKLYSNHKDYQSKPLSFYQLTQEEFELLKRWLGNE